MTPQCEAVSANGGTLTHLESKLLDKSCISPLSGRFCCPAGWAQRELQSWGRSSAPEDGESFESHCLCCVTAPHCTGPRAKHLPAVLVSKTGGFVPNPVHRHPLRAAERAGPWLELLAPNVAQGSGIYHPLCGSCLFSPMEIQVYSEAIGWNLHAFIITNSGWECRSKWCRTFF